MRANQFTPDATERHKRNRYIRRLHQMTGWDTSHLELLSNDELRDLHIQHQQERDNKPTDEAMSAGVRMQRALQREKEKRERSERYAEKHFPIGKPKEPKNDQNTAETSLPDVPKGWEAKTQPDGSTRISKIGSMSRADYEKNMADYKAKNWSPEKIAQHQARTASGQGYTDAERAANFQQQKQHFGQYADQQGVEEGLCEVCGTSLAEHGKASLKLCKSSKPDADLGASNLASCKSQGLRARDGDKSHKLGKGPESRVKVGGHRIKGKKYGGPLPDWS